jgi:NADP-dependent 3-hydroxy acid dehydrogenase YdfG
MNEKVFITGASSGIGAALATNMLNVVQPLAYQPADLKSYRVLPSNVRNLVQQMCLLIH